MIMLYILHGKAVLPEPNTLKWAMWFEKADRQVAMTEIGDAVVSTVFLGIATHFCEDGPVIFETLISGGPHDRMAVRSCTWEAAEQCHDVTAKRLREEMGLNQ